MPDLVRLDIIVCVLQLILKGTHGKVIVSPSNAVSELNGQVTFQCEGDQFQGTWYLSKNGVSSQDVLIVRPSCVLTLGFEAHYAVDTTGGPNVCNLVVANITMAQAGVYKCAEQDLVYALLTVIDSSPRMTYNNTPNVMEGENVVITYSLNYSGSVEPAPTLRPYFYWTDHTGNNVSSVYNPPPTNNSVVSQLTVTAGRGDIMPYTCHVYMQLIQTTAPGYATNTPTVDSRASSPIITVLYAPSTPAITSRPDAITINGVPCGISVLTCSNSTGNPVPNYRWFDTAENVIVSTTNTLTLAEINRNYKCEVYNTIRNVMHNTSATYTISEGNCASTVKCCVFPRDETTSVTVEGCKNGALCDCSQGNSGIILICNAKTFPNASYIWSGTDIEPVDSPVYDEVTRNGSYRCTAYFNKALSNYTGDVIFTNGTNDTTMGLCSQDAELKTSTISPTTSTMANTNASVCSPSTNSDVAAEVAIAMGVLFGISLLANIIFLLVFIRKQGTSKRKDIIPEPQIPYRSDPFPPTAYEELRPNDELNLQPTTYEQLTHRPPLYVNHVS